MKFHRETGEFLTSSKYLFLVSTTLRIGIHNVMNMYLRWRQKSKTSEKKILISFTYSIRGVTHKRIVASFSFIPYHPFNILNPRYSFFYTLHLYPHIWNRIKKKSSSKEKGCDMIHEGEQDKEKDFHPLWASQLWKPRFASLLLNNTVPSTCTAYNENICNFFTPKLDTSCTF